MDVLLTYDVSDKHSDLKREMKKLGYMDSWGSNNITYNLPNTTLWKGDSDLNKPIADLKSVCTSLRIRPERAICVQCDNWAGIPGDKH